VFVDKSDISKFSTSLSQAITAMRELMKIKLSLNFENLLQLKAEQTKHEDQISKVNSVLDSQNLVNNLISKSQEEIKSLEVLVDRLTNLKSYSQTKDSFKLLGLKNKITESRNDIAFLREVSNKGKDIEWESFVSSQQQLNKQKELTNNSLAENKKTKDSLEKRLNSLKGSLDRLGQLETEIKALGREYLTHTHDATECPLCSATYSYAELGRRINEVKSKIYQDTDISSIQDELSKLKTEIQVLEARVIQIARIEEVAKIVYEGDYSAMNISEIQSQLNESIALLAGAEQSLVEDLAFEERMKAKNLSEAVLLNLVTELKKAYPDFDDFKENESKLELLIRQTVEKAETLRGTIKENNARKERFTKELNEIAISLGGNLTEKSLSNILSDRLQLI